MVLYLFPGLLDSVDDLSRQTLVQHRLIGSHVQQHQDLRHQLNFDNTFYAFYNVIDVLSCISMPDVATYLAIGVSLKL